MAAQTAAPTLRTHGTPAKTRQHIFELNLEFLSVNPFEKLFNPDYGVVITRHGMSFPDCLFSRFREFAVRLKQRNVIPVRHMDKMFSEPAHLGSMRSPRRRGRYAPGCGRVSRRTLLRDSRRGRAGGCRTHRGQATRRRL